MLRKDELNCSQAQIGPPLSMVNDAMRMRNQTPAHAHFFVVDRLSSP